MKKNFIFTLFFMLIVSYSFGQINSYFEPQKPNPGQPILIKTNLKVLTDTLQCYTYIKEDNRELYVKKHDMLRKEGDTFVVEIPTSKSIIFLAYQFRINDKVIYSSYKNTILFYEGDSFLPNSKATFATYLISINNHILKWDQNNKLANKLFNEEFIVNPERKRENYMNYLYSFNLNDEEDKIALKQELENFKLINDLNAKEYSQLFMFYQKLGEDSKSTEFKENWYKLYPDDQFVVNHLFFEYSQKGSAANVMFFYL